MKKSRLLGVLCACLSAVVYTTSHAALVSRLGGQAYYDDVLNITWLADANLADTNAFGTAGIDAIGRMNWDTANTWIANMNADGGTGYLGFDDWRLPTMLDTGTSGCTFAYTGTDCGYNVQTGSAVSTVYSELASLYYDTLGNKAYYDTSGSSPQPGYGLTNTGPFSNVQSNYYWSGLEDASDNTNAWGLGALGADSGRQNTYTKTNNLYGWAVRTGDVAAVPVPAAAWLFGSGLLGLIGIARRKKAA